MRITLRLIVSLIVVVASVAFFSAYLQVRSERLKQQDDIERRARLLADSLQKTIEPIVEKGPSKNLQRLVEKFGNRERLAGRRPGGAHRLTDWEGRNGRPWPARNEGRA